MAKKSFKDVFMDELKRQSGGVEKAVNNNTLRKALGWEVPRYDKVWYELKADGLIYATRGGPGGATSLSAPTPIMPKNAIKLFLSYSHVDEEIKDELLKHLAPLRRLGKISEWHDKRIEAGDKWEEAILNALNTADIIILLISIDFINSDYCYVKEMDAALEREARKETVVIPVISRSCMWKDTKFKAYQALPKAGQAISTWPTRDEALTDVAEGIKKVADRLLNER